jgi:hypothetical protein
MTAENRDKVKMLFDLVLIANDVLPEQDRLTFSYSKYELFCTIMQKADPTSDIKLFWWVYYEPAHIPAKERLEKPHEYLTLDQAIERVREMIARR